MCQRNGEVLTAACGIDSIPSLCAAGYFALTLLIEAGSIKSLIHRARHRTMKRWRHTLGVGQQNRYQVRKSGDGSASGDVEAASQLREGEDEDVDVREERLMIESGTHSRPARISGFVKVNRHKGDPY